MAVAVETLAPSTSSHRGRLGGAFWRLWTASTVSNVGDGVALVAFPLMAASMTSSPTMVAGVAFALRVPWLFFALPAGAIADRVNRGHAMAVVDGARALLLGALVAAVGLGHITLPLLFLFAFGLGTLETVFAAASHGAVPNLVASQHLDRANGLLYASETVGADLVGPALGGLVFAAAASLPFFIDGVSFLASAVILVALAPRLPRPTRQPSVRLRSEISEGVRFLLSNDALRIITLLVGALALLQSAVMGVLVLMATRELGLSNAGYGLFVAVGAAGGIAGGLLASRVRITLGTASSLTAVTIAAAGGYLLIALAPNVGIAAVGLIIESFAVSCGNVTTLSLRQALVPDHLRGRVGNAFRMFIWGGVPVGLLAGGLIAGSYGVRAPILFAALLQLLLAAASARALRTTLVTRSDRDDEMVIDLTLESEPVAV